MELPAFVPTTRYRARFAYQDVRFSFRGASREVAFYGRRTSLIELDLNGLVQWGLVWAVVERAGNRGCLGLGLSRDRVGARDMVQKIRGARHSGKGGGAFL